MGKGTSGGDAGLATFGGILQILGPLLPFFSDRRLKTDIEKIGQTGEGHPKYRFRYRWDAPEVRRIGVMADEVPDFLVVTGPDGYKRVNYTGVTL